MKALQERAMLVRVSTHGSSFKKKDKQVSEVASSLNNADNDVVDAIINIAPPNEIKAINQASGKIRSVHNDLTLPWLRGGLSILPSEMYMEYREKMKAPIDNYYAVVASLASRWDGIIAKKNSRMGKLASKYKLPTADDIRRIFYVEQDMMQIPDVTDFRITVGDTKIDKEIQEQIKKSQEEAFNNATKSIYVKVSDILSGMVDALCTPDKKFRDNTITKIKSFCEVMPKYNLTNSKELEDLRKELVAKLGHLDPDDLREIPNNRKKAGADAKELLDKISQYL